MLAPLVHTIAVGCDQQTAYRLFVEHMASWWPLEKRSMSMHQGQKPKALLVEPWEGGAIVEVAPDDTRHRWGTFRRLVPYDFASLDFHMGLPAEQASLVEMRFRVLGAHRTEVELTQSNWEAFGDMAQMMRSSYGSSWGLIFAERYGAACALAGAGAVT